MVSQGYESANCWVHIQQQCVSAVFNGFDNHIEGGGGAQVLVEMDDGVYTLPGVLDVAGNAAAVAGSPKADARVPLSPAAGIEEQQVSCRRAAAGLLGCTTESTGCMSFEGSAYSKSVAKR